MSDHYENPDQMPENETPIEQTGTEPRGTYYSEYDEYRFRTPEGYPRNPR